MGCAPSSIKDVDALPVRPHYRTAFARTSTNDRASDAVDGSGGVVPLAVMEAFKPPPGTTVGGGAVAALVTGTAGAAAAAAELADCHDIVLCYTLSGTVFGLELTARYEKISSVSVWTPDVVMSVPGSPLGHAYKSVSANAKMRGDVSVTGAIQAVGASGDIDGAPPGVLEIKPAPQDGAAVAASTAAMMLNRQIRFCSRGVIVLLTSGCTWDDGVLACMRLAARWLRPLVLVHCCQSCPLPALEEWPADVRPLIAGSGRPVKYLSQHAAEALRDVEERFLAAAAAAEAAASAAAGTAAAANGGAKGLSIKQRQEEQAVAAAQRAYAASAASVAAAAAAGMRDGPLSLAALRHSAAAGQLNRRAAQLLGPWTTTNSDVNCRSQGHTSAGSARGDSGGISSNQVSITPIEAITTDIASESETGGRGTSAPPATRSLFGASTASDISKAAALAAVAAEPFGGGSDGVGARKAGSAAAATVQGKVSGSGEDGAVPVPSPRLMLDAEVSVRDGGLGGPAAAWRCVLRYRHGSWAAPVAYLCAQLEEELGRAQVAVQTATAAAAPTAAESAVGAAAAAAAPAGQAGGAATDGGAVSGPTVIGAQRSHADGPQAVASAHAVGAARAGAGSGCGGDGWNGGDGLVVGDELAALTSPRGNSDCGLPAPLLASAADAIKPTAATAAAANGSWAHAAADAGLASSFAGGNTDTGGGGGGGGGDVTVVQFLTPGLVASAACLHEAAARLALGRRLVLVSDGEYVQRLPPQPPVGITPESWKAVRQLWRERLLYVRDYHTSFADLLLNVVNEARSSARG
ncbi:hypothetical protein HYH02_009716 [Chlamydomonas schloesseri]|uniref:Uncharacterized protein n=1 Tax=Chlamydomonas schloesseri TaxID=2026947 RepID=A0A835TEH1_9CHLO|nr:hypothetical protein HYH02_009716 [Chlamydomonas schloesseri]|eukprot:KAG2442232.1 hypothetical protein HYH02_009716 [Chlamydomonas schloesseri]